jgi:hypothetical protein
MPQVAQKKIHNSLGSRAGRQTAKQGPMVGHI